MFPAILSQQREGFPIRVSPVMVAASVVAVPGISALIHRCDLLEILI
jgi:hypothetical protein